MANNPFSKVSFGSTNPTLPPSQAPLLPSSGGGSIATMPWNAQTTSGGGWNPYADLAAKPAGGGWGGSAMDFLKSPGGASLTSGAMGMIGAGLTANEMAKQRDIQNQQWAAEFALKQQQLGGNYAAKAALIPGMSNYAVPRGMEAFTPSGGFMSPISDKARADIGSWYNSAAGQQKASNTAMMAGLGGTGSTLNQTASARGNGPSVASQIGNLGIGVGTQIGTQMLTKLISSFL